MRLCELTKIVPILAIADHTSGVTMDAFCMKDFGHATIVFTFAALTGDYVLTVTQGATAAANTAALPFDYTYTETNINSDGAETCIALANDADGVLSLADGTYDNRMLIIEIDGKSLTDGYDWVDMRLSNDGAGYATALLILSEPRYASDLGETCLS